MDRGRLRGDASLIDLQVVPRLLVGTTLSAMRGSMALWLAGGGKASLPDLLATCFDLLDAGLGEVGELRVARA